MVLSLTDCTGPVPHGQLFSVELLDSLLTSYSSRWISALAFFAGG